MTLTFDNENNSDGNRGRRWHAGGRFRKSGSSGNAAAASSAAGARWKSMTEEEMVAEAIRRGEETAEAAIAADAQRAKARSATVCRMRLDSVSRAAS